MADGIIRSGTNETESAIHRVEGDMVSEHTRTIEAERRKAALRDELAEQRLLAAEARHAEETIVQAESDKALMA